MSKLVDEIGQLIMIGLVGPSLSRRELSFIRKVQPSGVTYFRRNVESPRQLIRLSASLWKECNTAPLIAIDQEGGRVARLGSPFTAFPGNDYLGRYVRRTGQTKWVASQAVAMANELKAIGVNYNFTPVADIDSNTKNPIIGSRAFGTSPRQVARLVACTVRAYRQAGIISCAKHFPGHGDTHSDSHKVLPTVKASKETIFRRELVPFRSAVGANVPTIMTAHVMYPALDRKNPATLSKHILLGLLRRRLGFKGVIVSDDLEMNAIARHSTLADAAVDALNAGVDLLLVCKSLDEAASVHARLICAVQTGELHSQRVEEALRRVGKLKKTYLRRRFLGGAFGKSKGWSGHQNLSQKIQILGKP